MTQPRKPNDLAHMVAPLSEVRAEDCTTFARPHRKYFAGLPRNRSCEGNDPLTAVSGSDCVGVAGCVGGACSCQANHSSGACRAQVRTSEQLFSRNFREKNFPNSVASSGRSGLTNRSPCSQSGRSAASGMRVSLSRASASRMPARSLQSIPSLSNNLRSLAHARLP